MTCLLFITLALYVAYAAGQTCIHEGVEYNQGDRVPVDSCNTCICSGPGIMCTLMACPEHQPGCYLDGTFYQTGDSMPSPDCNRCFCAGTVRACTRMACPENVVI
ncbi:cysteine-rich motor neuron 1 protein-like [Physella acuta]|uniref:cysteine-rich motor neuron 1 protein-like n=1 Tax=Physella acuta TaxID=109671 RepID=UPI0027DC4FFC|nr:cysteine-rich motor neuron 1 protein-like [Physella acuta]